MGVAGKEASRRDAEISDMLRCQVLIQRPPRQDVVLVQCSLAQVLSRLPSPVMHVIMRVQES